MKRKLALAAGALVAALAGVFWIGAYDISATDQHLAPTYWLLDTGMKRSVALRARRVDVPALDDPVQIAQGAALFHRHCLQCHGGPGIPPEPFALGLTPAAANLAHTARAWSPGELFWTIDNGIKMTGMPAWRYRMRNDEMWAVVAFLRVLPSLTPAEYLQQAQRALAGAAALPGTDAVPATKGDAQRGRSAMHQYACATCHEIPGIVGANAPVGPPLAGMARRAFIAGVLPYTNDAMMRWLRSPQSVSPRNAMPDLGVSAQDAADIAAYLATLD